ncbi:hypothetical protein Poli38472_000716 [Pythium oligandrum]|uniref:Dihydropteridine reductase n=1 Tax=Pythium oligandrum TaxID=41045 RepID=A0A8K1FH52_PYTOL|nr:hypothetical protein Poli38472_000716 [Pythium oligandrum]|eukprot:TMW60674.1 hypothetical protein Poli38472_000716 [Pythium oligandrum]
MAKRLVVIGGAGALGRGVISRFTRSSWKALSVDFTKNDESTSSFVFDKTSASTLTQASHILEHANKTFGKVDAVVCTAGGWAGGSVQDADTLVNLAEMHSKNTESALLAAHVASQLLNPGGLLVLTGAAAALKVTPGMISYGISKAATHHLIASTVESLPKDATVLGVLPLTIDTPMNRKFMGDADFSTWTSTEEIGDKILEWSEASSAERPQSGHLVTVVTENNKSTWKDVGNPFL